MRFLSLVLFGAMSCAAVADDLSPIEQLGKSVFFDANLSATGTQSCSSCHDPAFGFASPLGSQSQLISASGMAPGAVEGRFGNRKPPTVAYMSYAPPLFHGWEDGAPLFVGGAFVDGRATGHRLGLPIADQVEGPFLNPVEMALPHQACVVARVCAPKDPSAYPITMTDVWGPEACSVALPEGFDQACANPDAPLTIGDEALLAQVNASFDQIALSLAAYEGSAEVNRFSSRFDQWAAGMGDLTDLELAGFALFKDKAKCAQCHVLGPRPSGEGALFTDFTYDNVGVPRNRANPWYGQLPFNPLGEKWVDKGLAATLEKDEIYAPLAASAVGKQKVPTLRNLDKRPDSSSARTYTHNGYFKTLEGVVHFYNTRDVLPRCANATASEAEAMAQGCWPAPEIPENVNRDEMGDLKLTASEEAAIVAFLKTLSDE